MAKPKSAMAQVGRYLSLAMMLPLCVLIGFVIGHLLDKWLGTTFLRITFVICGIAAGFLQLIRELSAESREP